jgi:predicted nucleotidyltransferase component of viral defense system
LNSIEVLTKQLARLLKCKILPPGSYLAGGTAVYFYLNHRLSVDLDFFSPNDFTPEVFVQNMRECIDNVLVELMEEKTIILFLSREKIKFSLFSLPYKLLDKPQSYALQDNIICPLASLMDIEAMKGVAIAQRGSAKDFIDLYFMLRKTGHCYDDICKFVMNKYDLGEDYEYQLKTSFLYFDDAEKEVENIMMLKQDGAVERIKEKEWHEIKKFFKEFLK